MSGYLDDYRIRPRRWKGDQFFCPTLIIAATNRDLRQLVAEGQPVSVTDEIPFKLPSDWMALARAEGDLGQLPRTPGWRPPRHRPGGRAWTDDYSSVLAAFRGP